PSTRIRIDPDAVRRPRPGQAELHDRRGEPLGERPPALVQRRRHGERTVLRVRDAGLSLPRGSQLAAFRGGSTEDSAISRGSELSGGDRADPGLVPGPHAAMTGHAAIAAAGDSWPAPARDEPGDAAIDVSPVPFAAEDFQAQALDTSEQGR